MLAEQRKPKPASTHGKAAEREAKLTQAEMAYEPPADVSDPKRFVTLARGRKEWDQFLSYKRGFVRLDPEVRKAFPDDQAINELLRKVMELRSIGEKRNKKSA